MARAVAIDANLLLVYLVGSKHAEYLGKKRHLRAYMPEDYATLCNILSQFDRILVTPNVVSECNNLLPDSKDFDDARDSLKEFIIQNQIVEEVYIPSVDAASMSQFTFLGIADCSMLALVNDEIILLTADQKLAREAQMINYNSINFNHYRNFVC